MTALELSRQQLLDGIRAKCVEENPEIEKYICCACSSGMLKSDSQCVVCGCGLNTVLRPIRLADVLLAHIAAVDAMYHPKHPEKRDAEYTAGTLRICGKWNLRRDSLGDQNHECLTFIYSLLFF